jgi:hypothetical protein
MDNSLHKLAKIIKKVDSLNAVKLLGKIAG